MSSKTHAVCAAGVVALLFLPGSAHAQTPPPPGPPATGGSQTAPAPAPNPFQGWTLSATLEGYYQWDTNRPPDRVIPLRAYDTRANSFSLQQAALVIEQAPDRSAERPFGLRLDLQFGQATEALQGSPANEPRPDVYRPVWQAYGSYVFPSSRLIRLDLGKFASSLGFETNYAKDNNNFSRAYLFNFLPYYHEGARLQVQVNDKVSIYYMLTNGIQQTEDFNNFKSNHFEAVLTPDKKISWTVNYYFGQEQPDGGAPDGPNGWFRVFDTYLTFTPSAKLSLGADVNRTTNQRLSTDPSAGLVGAAGYARYQIAAANALSVRYEYIDDSGGLFGGVAQKLQEMTFGVEHKVADGFLARGEVRRDWSNQSFFPAHDGETRKGQTTVLIGLVWWFGGTQGPW
jgi:Putative beta-barrel porin-2, OmpL-like. bbp2